MKYPVSHVIATLSLVLQNRRHGIGKTAPPRQTETTRLMQSALRHYPKSCFELCKGEFAFSVTNFENLLHVMQSLFIK